MIRTLGLAAVCLICFGCALKLPEIKKRGSGRTEYKLEEHVVEEWQVGPNFEVPIPIWNWGQAAYAGGRMEILRRWNLYTSLAIDLTPNFRRPNALWQRKPYND